MASKVDLIEKAHEPRDVDLSASGRGVWLVKVPKYLSEKWKSCSSGQDVGKLRITKSIVPNKKPDIVFTSYEVNSSAESLKSKLEPAKMIQTLSMPPSIAPVSIVPKPAPSAPTTNRNHKFILTGVGNQNLVVMSQFTTDGNDSSEKLSIEGKVLQRAECHPIVDANYQQLKQQQVKAKNTPVRQMKLLPGIVHSYKPISDHAFNLEDKKYKKNEVKRTRAEKDKVMDILFNAFEKHQFYNVRDLVGITKQPVPYLKEILKEICNYNMTAPHKNMWELKPEFRHYKQQDGEGE